MLEIQENETRLEEFDGRFEANPRYITPTMAGEWLRDMKYDPQRQVREGHVERLARVIRDGELADATAIIIYHCAGKSYLVDGQHRLHAAVRADKPILQVVIERWVDDFSQVEAAYPRLGQSMPQILKDSIRGGRLHEKWGMSLEEATKLAHAIKVLLVGFQGQNATGAADERYNVRDRAMIFRGCDAWKEEAKQFYTAIQGGLPAQRRRLSYSPILAVALPTFRHQQDAAFEFWKRASERDRLEANAGEWYLAMEVLQHSVGIMNVASRRVALCWNAYFEKRILTHEPTVKDPSKPIRIAGTNYTGKGVIREYFLAAEEGHRGG